MAHLLGVDSVQVDNRDEGRFGFNSDEDEPKEESTEQPATYFNSTSSITTGVFALMLCFRFAGM